MKQVAFISGKGGTGKSTLVASLVQITKNKRFADCDVDAPNLHLLVAKEQQDPKPYLAVKKR
jgi:MinD superfamily P-loop ATPase